jgi:hypothetical protein
MDPESVPMLFIFGLFIGSYAAGTALSREMRSGTALAVLSNVITTGPAGDLVLEAAEDIGADVDQSGNLVIQPILIDLHDGAALSARTDANVYVKEMGNMNVSDIYVTLGRVEL